MYRLNTALRALLAVFFCFAFIPSAFAVDDTLGGSLRPNAVSTRTSSDVSSVFQTVTLERAIVLDRHTPSLYRYWERQDTFYKRTNPWGDGYCRSVMFRGATGYVCDAAVWKNIPRGTVISVPAGVVSARVSPGANAPEAIALSRTKDGAYVLNARTPVVTRKEIQLSLQVSGLKQEVAQQRNLVIVLLITAAAFFALFVLMVILYEDRRHQLKKRDRTIAEMVARAEQTSSAILKV